MTIKVKSVIIFLSVMVFILFPNYSYSISSAASVLPLQPLQTGGGPQGEVRVSVRPEGLEFLVRAEKFSLGSSVSDRSSNGETTLATAAINRQQMNHISLWISFDLNPTLPNIGWATSDSHVELKSRDDCKKALGEMIGPDVTTRSIRNCQKWFDSQAEYRKNLKKLFIRQWNWIADDAPLEVYATPAFNTIMAGIQDNSVRGLLAPLQPQGMPVIEKVLQKNDKDENPSFSWYQMLIPWQALPASSHLSLLNFYLRIDLEQWTAEDGKVLKKPLYASTSSKAKIAQANADSFQSVQLSSAMSARNEAGVFEVTPCRYSLDAEVDRDQSYGNRVNYFILNKNIKNNNEVRDTFNFKNLEKSGQYEPELPSPLPNSTHYFWKEIFPSAHLAKGSLQDDLQKPQYFICGPRLSFWNGEKKTVLASDIHIDPSGLHPQNIRATDWAPMIQALDAQDWLLALTPEAYVADEDSGQCGDCPIQVTRVFLFNINKGFKTLFDYKNRVNCSDFEGGEDEAIELSSDLQKIKLYRRKASVDSASASYWRMLNYCLQGQPYQYVDCDTGIPLDDTVPIYDFKKAADRIPTATFCHP